MATKRQSNADWIAEVVLDEVDGKKCSAIAVYHKEGNQDVEIFTVKLGNGKETDFPALAKVLTNKAESYCQDFPGVQYCGLLAFYGDDKSEPRARHPFTVEIETQFKGLATEAPDERGFRQQGMRLTEAIVQNTFRMQGMLFNASQTMLEYQTRTNERLATENMDMFAILKEMMVAKAIQETDKAQELLQFQRASAERQKLMTMAPALINTITGRNVFPQSTSDTALIEMLADSLDAEKVKMMAMVLPPEVMGIVATRFQQVLAKRKTEEDAAALAIRKAKPGNDGGGNGGGESGSGAAA